MRIEDRARPVTGEIYAKIYKNNKVIEEISDHNLVMDVGRKRLAELAAGKVASYINSYISHI